MPLRCDHTEELIPPPPNLSLSCEGTTDLSQEDRFLRASHSMTAGVQVVVQASYPFYCRSDYSGCRECAYVYVLVFA
jgi:hypothetical protein